MGQCPMYIPAEDSNSETVGGDSKDNSSSSMVARMSEGCFGADDVCIASNVTNITRAKYDKHRFLVSHDFDDVNLVDVNEVRKIYEREHMEHIRQRSKEKADKDFDDAKTDVTTATRYAATDISLNSYTGTDVHSVITSKVCNADKYKSATPPTPTDAKAPTPPSNKNNTNIKVKSKSNENDKDNDKDIGTNKESTDDLTNAKDILQKRHLKLKETIDQTVEKDICGINCTDPFAQADPMFREGTALHLTLRANLVEFYQTKYLEMFPDSPLPVGMRRVDPQNRISTSGNGPMEAIEEPVPPLVPVNSHDSSQTNGDSLSSARDNNDVCARLERDGSSFLNLATHGSLGLLEHLRDLKSSRPGAAAGVNNHKLVLHNRRSGEVLAVCTLRSVYGPPVVRMYATKPRVTGQSPAEGVSYRNHVLYSWAEFTVEGEFPLPVRYFVSMAVGDKRFEDEPRFRGSHMDVGSPNIRMTARSEDGGYRGCCLLSLRTNDVGDRTNFSLILSKGVDPALFICLTSIIDEVLENTMRQQYSTNQRKKRKSLKKINA